MPDSTIFRSALRGLAPASIAVLAVACNPPTKPGPVVTELTIQSVVPALGPAAGGTEVTIRGAGFGSGAAVTVGGRPASNVSARGTDLITATTPASTIAGAVDVAVVFNGRSATLAGAFRYDVVPSTPPVIKSITAQGSRSGQPPLFADYGETIRVSAVVEDAETPAAQLKYEWLACGGTFIGSGPQVDWKAPPVAALPRTCTIQLIVIDGSTAVTSSVIIRLHDSAKEVAALALEFLNDFANSNMPAELTVRNFSNSCRGKTDELADVTRNRATRTINSHTYGTPMPTVAFGGSCGVLRSVDACVITPVEWRSTVKETQTLEVAKGTSIISGVYRDSRWWLCDSLFQGASSLGLHFMD